MKIKKFFPAFAILVFSQMAFAQQGKLLTLEDIWSSRQFTATGLSDVRSMKNDAFYTQLDAEDKNTYIVKYEFKTGKAVDTLLRSSAIVSDGKSIVIEDYFFSDDEKALLVETESEAIYRHSTKANYYVYSLVTGKSEPVSKNGKQQYATFSPDGKKVAFVRDNNIFIKNLSDGSEKAITTDGKKNEIINGATDWVYEEEFSFDQAYQWSPDGKYLAYYRFDESKVKEFNLTYYESLYPREERYKYPKAGEDNSVVEIYIYQFDNNKSVKTDVNKEADQYIPRIKWTADAAKLCVMRMNRLQNHIDLFSCDASTGSTSVFFTEDSKTYLEVPEVMEFLPNKRHMIWISGQDGYNHLYRIDITNKLKEQITSGKWEVTKFYGYDQNSGNFFFQAAAKNPMGKEVYVASSKGKIRLLGPDKGTNDALFSRNFKYCFITNSGIDKPNEVALYFWNGNKIRTIEDNKPVRDAMAKFQWSKAEFFNFTTSEGIVLNGWMIKPPSFSASKKYPVIQYMYGGPGSQTVTDSWKGANYVWFQMLAQKGYIIVSVDNRGTGGRGEEFTKCIYKQLGHFETIDQIEVAKWLSKQPYVDAQRIGAWGWSYGGYMTSLLMTKGADYFKAAVAVAPVTNWRYYDSIYTERYLQTPQMNASGYDDNSPINFTDKLKGKFLLVHGAADDNVHFQNSMEFVDALVKNKKQFDVFFYPNKAHSISGVRLHLFQKMTDFYLTNL